MYEKGRGSEKMFHDSYGYKSHYLRHRPTRPLSIVLIIPMPENIRSLIIGRVANA